MAPWLFFPLHKYTLPLSFVLIVSGSQGLSLEYVLGAQAQLAKAEAAKYLQVPPCVCYNILMQ